MLFTSTGANFTTGTDTQDSPEYPPIYNTRELLTKLVKTGTSIQII